MVNPNVTKIMLKFICLEDIGRSNQKGYDGLVTYLGFVNRRCIWNCDEEISSTEDSGGVG
jgi:hypothetical protein